MTSDPLDELILELEAALPPRGAGRLDDLPPLEDMQGYVAAVLRGDSNGHNYPTVVEWTRQWAERRSRVRPQAK